MALVSGNRIAQDWLWWHQSGSGALGSGLEDGAARSQRAHGRTKAVVTDPTLQADLEALLEPKGDPMSLIKWTSHSLTQMVKALSGQGHRIKRTALADLLHQQDYSLKGLRLIRLWVMRTFDD